MVELQRNIAKDCSVVMEGRDIGSVVFPNADVKIYLTASCVERAKRRQLDLRRKGIDIRLEDVIKEIEKRDTADITKPISPLVKCDDAIEIDTTELSKDEVVLMVIDILKKRGLMERG